MSSAVAVFASARRDGNTGRLIDRIADEVGIEVIDLAALRIAPYDYEHSNRDDDFEPLMGGLLEHDRIVFASPVYWYAVAPAMKIFLDRVTDFLELPDLLQQGRRLRAKTGFVVCTSIYDTPPAPFLDAFRMTFDYLGMRYGGCAHLNCVNGFDEAGAEAEVAVFWRAMRG